MTDNQKLQLWQTGNKYKIGAGAPDYLNDDPAAMSLLDTLVENGYEPKLQYYRNIKQWGMMPDEDCGYEWLGDTRLDAVCVAVLEQIGKECV